MRGVSGICLLAFCACSGELGDTSRGDKADNADARGGRPDQTSGQPPASGHEFDCNAPGQQDPGPYLVRRLTPREYINTVRSTLGVDVSDLDEQLPRNPAESFSHTYVVSYEDVAAYAELAQSAVERLPNLTAFAGCETLTFLCEEQFIEAAGAALFRRPTPSDESEPLYELFRAASAAGASFDAAARLVLESMLQSPRFLYRIESQEGNGPIRDLDGYELASKLSYALWDEPPDEELKQAAESGALETDAGVTQQVDRMLRDPRAIEVSLRFLEDWMGLDRTADLPRGAAMREETESLFRHVVWDKNQSLTTLFNAPYTFVSQELAEFYGLDNVQAGLSHYALGDDQPRRGILTHGSMLSAGGALGSPVLRGLFVLDRVLCSEVGPPPPGVNLMRPEPEPGRGVRYYSEQRVADPVCGGCHRQFEPLSYGIEPFAADGTVRTVDERGNPFRSDGVFRTPYNTEGVPYEDTLSFAETVAADQRVRDCTTIRLGQFALGRPIDVADACTLSEAREQIEPDSARYTDLLRSILTQPAFRQIRTD